MEQLCGKCGGPNRRFGQRWCHLCHAAYMRAHRPKYRDLSPEAKRRSNCRAYANEYQRRGKLVPQPCEVCGTRPTEKHHDDYTKPLQVRWFCRHHHALKTRLEACGAVNG